MKTIFKTTAVILYLFSTFFITSGCDKKKDSTPVDTIKEEQKEERLNVILNTFYDTDTVSVEIDGQIVFSDIISTDVTFNPAWIFHVNMLTGQHEISVTVNDAKITQIFEHKKDLSVVIYYTKQISKITCSFTTDELLFD